MNTVRDKAIDELYTAVENYIRIIGGDVVVIGGIQIQRWPEDNSKTFNISVKCSGRSPVKFGVL